MKRSENVMSRESSGGQNDPSSSSTGNPKSRIILGWVPLIKHIATFTFYFQSHTDIYISSKKFTFQIGLNNLLEFVAFCANSNPKSWKETRVKCWEEFSNMRRYLR